MALYLVTLKQHVAKIVLTNHWAKSIFKLEVHNYCVNLEGYIRGHCEIK